jgi:hypothetical protein
MKGNKTMKRYLVFAGMNYYPRRGGLLDFSGCFDSYVDAKRSVLELLTGDHEWAQIWDTNEHIASARYYYSDDDSIVSLKEEVERGW